MSNSTDAVTFRFDKIVLDQLKTEANQKRINLNTLVNQIVKSHIEWHANAAKAGFIPIRKQVVTRLFDSLTVEQVDKIAVDIARGLTDETMLVMAKKPTIESILELLERWLRFSGFNYHHKVEEYNHRHTYVIQHNMGKHWSYYLARLLEKAISEFAESVPPDVDATENALYIRLSVK